jgi:phosphoglucomutase
MFSAMTSLAPTAASEHVADSICEALGTRYGALGAQAAIRLKHWLSGAVPYAYPEILQQHLSAAHLDLLFDCFWQELPFGTGGRRGRVGYGPNRINPTTIAMAVQGHCRYLRENFPDRKPLEIVIANDVRVFSDVAGTYRFLGSQHPLLGISSRSLARLACEIYAANGIVAYLAEPHADTAYLSTPELSFLVGALGAVGGIVLSASHNPPDDNGIKLYDQHGGQPVAPDDQILLDAMSQSLDVQAMPFAQAREAGWVRPIPADRHDRYVRAYVDLYGKFGDPRPDLPIVYTPLCGCGLTSVGDVLKALKFPFQSPPAEGPDGTFAVIPFRSPNPEVPQSTEPARRFADQIGSGIVVSSDPDADRAGLEVKLADGSWYHFDGNQIASILCYALMLDPDGPRRTGLVVETLVTTKLLRRIAEMRGDSPVIDDLLVGFKYVAEVLKNLEATGRYRNVSARPSQLILAAEESHGVCLLPEIHDKDSTPACIFLAGLYQRLRLRGETLLDYYLAIIERVGAYDSVNRSLMMSGPEGVQRRDRIMSWLRSSPLDRLAGAKVLRMVDHWDESQFGPFVSESDKLPRNTIEIYTDRFVAIVRPSGTEPKVKFYCHLLPEGAPTGIRGRELLSALHAEAERIAAAIYRDLLAPLGISLGDPALALPDIVDLDKKSAFERDIVPALEERIREAETGETAPTLAWLHEACSRLIPGADPLPALKASVGVVCARVRSSEKPMPLLNSLVDWARS